MRTHHMQMRIIQCNLPDTRHASMGLSLRGWWAPPTWRTWAKFLDKPDSAPRSMRDLMKRFTGDTKASVYSTVSSVLFPFASNLRVCRQKPESSPPFEEQLPYENIPPSEEQAPWEEHPFGGQPTTAATYRQRPHCLSGSCRRIDAYVYR